MTLFRQAAAKRGEEIALDGLPRGRYVQWRERAWDYAFIADSLGAT